MNKNDCSINLDDSNEKASHLSHNKSANKSLKDIVKINSESLAAVNVDSLRFYYDLIKDEYNREQSLKQSFETRAGLALAILGALSVFLLEKIKISELYSLMQSQLNFFSLIKVCAIITTYISITLSFYFLIKVINIHSYEAINIEELQKDFFVSYDKKLENILDDYKFIVLNCRKINEEKAKSLYYSLNGILVLFITLIIYFSFK